MQKVKISECHNIESQLSAYMDKALPLWKSRIFRWHLKRCSNCSKIYTELHQTHTILKHVDHVKASDNFLSNVMTDVTLMNTKHKEKRPIINLLCNLVEKFQIWMRANIRTYNSCYIMGFFSVSS